VTETPVLDAHRKRLTQAFAQHVLALRPASLLDVGCGEGVLLAMLAEANVEVKGVDTSAKRSALARERGLTIQEAEAGTLPFEAGSFDWVVIRHVLHHLEEPALAVREAWRVARRGVLLAEPTTDPSIPSQRAMQRFDTFTHRWAALDGHIHHPYLSAGDLIALVPETPQRVETRGYGELTPMPSDEARAIALKSAHDHALDEDDQKELEDFVREAGAGGLSYNGSVAVFAHRFGAIG
jgi:SAM-dependent methyltransferase